MEEPQTLKLTNLNVYPREGLSTKFCIMLFDSKLQWQPQVSNAIKKAKRSLHTLNLIRLYFTNDDVRQLVTSYLSELYYNSAIWHIPTLNHFSKQQLLLALSLALNRCTSGNTDRI